jgi:hypothetical protein
MRRSLATPDIRRSKSEEDTIDHRPIVCQPPPSWASIPDGWTGHRTGALIPDGSLLCQLGNHWEGHGDKYLTIFSIPERQFNLLQAKMRL